MAVNFINDRMNSPERMLADAVKVTRWQYSFLPLWMFIRHPFNTEEWFVQIKRTTTVDDIRHIEWYLKKIKYLGEHLDD